MKSKTIFQRAVELAYDRHMDLFVFKMGLASRADIDVGDREVMSKLHTHMREWPAYQRANRGSNLLTHPRDVAELGYRPINLLPSRFRWTIHNMIGHPLMEVFSQLGRIELGNKIHDATMPTEHEG